RLEDAPLVAVNNNRGPATHLYRTELRLPERERHDRNSLGLRASQGKPAPPAQKFQEQLCRLRNAIARNRPRRGASVWAWSSTRLYPSRSSHALSLPPIKCQSSADMLFPERQGFLSRIRSLGMVGVEGLEPSTR